MSFFYDVVFDLVDALALAYVVSEHCPQIMMYDV